MHVPRVVTIEIGPAVQERSGCFAPLGPDELVSVVDELADLRIGEIRFSLHDGTPVDSLCRAAEHAHRRGAETTIVVDGVLPTADVLRDLYGARPAAIAVPLHLHEASSHDAIPGRTKSWRELAGVAAAVRRTGAALEVETRVMRPCAVTLSPIAEAAEELGAERWRVDFSGVRLRSSIACAAAEAILDAALRHSFTMTVQELPALRRALFRRLHDHRSVPDLRRFHAVEGRDALRITRCGNIHFGSATATAGNVRFHALDAVVAQASVAAHVEPPLQLLRA